MLLCSWIAILISDIALVSMLCFSLAFCRDTVIYFFISLFIHPFIYLSIHNDNHKIKNIQRTQFSSVQGQNGQHRGSSHLRAAIILW